MAEFEQLVGFRQFAVFAFAFGTTAHDLYSVLHDQSPNPSEALKAIKAKAERLQPYAQAEAAQGLSYLNGLLVVRLVTLLESIVNDAVVWAIRNKPDVMRRDELRRLRGSLVDFLLASEGDRAAFLADALAHETRAMLKVGVGRFETLLSVVGLSGAVDDIARRAILELVEVRNVVVHRCGRADARLAEMCPWMTVRSGDRLVITEGMLQQYASAVSYYFLEIVKRWMAGEGHDLSEVPNLVAIHAKALGEVHRLQTT